MSGIQSHGNAKSQEGAAVAAVKATMDVECDSAYHNNLVGRNFCLIVLLPRLLGLYLLRQMIIASYCVAVV